MSQNYKAFRESSAQPASSASPSAVNDSDRQRVSQLIAANKSAQAMDFAKEVHRRCHSAASEALLLDAYGARLDWLLGRNLDRDATALMELVRERYPGSRERLAEWGALFAFRQGDLSKLLEPLKDRSLATERQAAILAKVRRDVPDLRAIADCPALPPRGADLAAVMTLAASAWRMRQAARKRWPRANWRARTSWLPKHSRSATHPPGKNSRN